MKMEYRDLDEIKLDFLGREIPYEILLTTNIWNKKRSSIRSRDEWKCTNCQAKGKLAKVNFLDENGKIMEDVPSFYVRNPKGAILDIHHQYYKQNSNGIFFNPWDYDDNALITVCRPCHKTIHEKKCIPVFRQVNGKLIKLDLSQLTPCKRCNAMGRLPQFNHVHNGICFECKGLRYKEFLQAYSR